MTTKIQALVGRNPVDFDYGNSYVRETVGGRERLRVGLSRSHDSQVLQLALVLTAPWHLLYVLHTTRTGASLGRYESPELGSKELRDFFKRFGRYLSEDSRHDLWVRSHADDATIVLDRHNLIYAYGPLDAFEQVLIAAGVRDAPVLGIPDPHVHNYHSEWDQCERDVLRELCWEMKPLREVDIQSRV